MNDDVIVGMPRDVALAFLEHGRGVTLHTAEHAVWVAIRRAVVSFECRNGVHHGGCADECACQCHQPVGAASTGAFSAAAGVHGTHAFVASDDGPSDVDTPAASDGPGHLAPIIDLHGARP